MNPMGKRTITILAVIAIVVAALQYTPLQFLSKDVSDFVGGLAAGLTIGAVITWILGPPKIGR
jgi:hypothetical protein